MSQNRSTAVMQRRVQVHDSLDDLGATGSTRCPVT